jgi:hypothetical protein
MGHYDLEGDEPEAITVLSSAELAEWVTTCP